MEIQDSASDCVGRSRGGLAVFQHLSLRGPLCFQHESLFANYERIAELNIRDMKEGKVLNYTPATLAEELRLQSRMGLSIIHR